MSEFEKYITDSGLVEFAEWHFKKDECGEYLHEPTNIAHKIWGEKDRVIGHKQNEIDLLKRLIEIKDQGSKEQQDQIAELKTQLNNMEQCYIQLKQEHNELIAFNTEIDRKQKSAEKTAEKYKFKVSMIGDLLRDSTDQNMTLKAIQTVIDRVGEHG